MQDRIASGKPPTHSFFSGKSLMTSFLHRRSKNGFKMLCS